jgi:hypothetical protein
MISGRMMALTTPSYYARRCEFAVMEGCSVPRNGGTPALAGVPFVPS